jgi:hypothetical protein
MAEPDLSADLDQVGAGERLKRRVGEPEASRGASSVCPFKGSMTNKRPLREPRVAGVPHAWGKACLRRSHGRTVVPFAMDEPPQASWDLSVTADANCLCTVTAIPSPWSPETCPWSSDGEESGQE